MIGNTVPGRCSIGVDSCCRWPRCWGRHRARAFTVLGRQATCSWTLELPFRFLCWLAGRCSYRPPFALSRVGARLFSFSCTIQGAPSSSLVCRFLHGLGRWLKSFANSLRNVVRKNVAGAQTTCDIHSLLPTFEFPSAKLLESPILLELFVLIIVIIQIQVAHLVKSTRELAPCALPLDISSLSTSSP